MPSRVYVICNAYESGVGHGWQNDGHDNADNSLYDDAELNEAYQIGYKEGNERFHNQDK